MGLTPKQALDSSFCNKLQGIKPQLSSAEASAKED